MDGRMIRIPRNVLKIKCHDIAPAYLLFKHFDLWQLSALATVVFVIIVVATIFLTPFFKCDEFVGM